MSCGADILMIAFGYSFSRFCVELLIHVAEKYDDRTIWKTFLDSLRSLETEQFGHRHIVNDYVWLQESGQRQRHNGRLALDSYLTDVIARGLSSINFD